MMPDIQRSDELEIQMAELIPIFIDNLGSPKVSILSIYLFTSFFGNAGCRPKINSQMHWYLCEAYAQAGVRGLAHHLHRFGKPQFKNKATLHACHSSVTLPESLDHGERMLRDDRARPGSHQEDQE